MSAQAPQCNIRAALIAALEATRDDDGKWVDRNGDYVEMLNEAPPESECALRFEREADAMRIGNGHLRDKLEEMTGWRNECGFRYNAEKEKTAKLRAALSDCLLMSPLNPFERAEMIRRVLEETA